MRVLAAVADSHFTPNGARRDVGVHITGVHITARLFVAAVEFNGCSTIPRTVGFKTSRLASAVGVSGWHQVVAGYVDCVNDNRHESSTTVDIGRVARLTLAAAIVAAVVLVAVDNRRDVRVGYVVGDTEGPIWIVLLAAGVAGVIVGWLIQHRPRRHRG